MVTSPAFVRCGNAILLSDDFHVMHMAADIVTALVIERFAGVAHTQKKPYEENEKQAAF